MMSRATFRSLAVIPSNFFKSSKLTRSNTLMAFVAVDRE